jgi:hypothetical protein
MNVTEVALFVFWYCEMIVRVVRCAAVGNEKNKKRMAVGLSTGYDPVIGFVIFILHSSSQLIETTLLWYGVWYDRWYVSRL